MACFAALLLAFAAYCTVGSAVFRGDLPDFYERLDISKGFRSLGCGEEQAIMVPNAKRTSRPLLQFRASQFCRFDDDNGTCSAAVRMNVPDEQMLDFFINSDNCLRTSDETKCNENEACKWSGGSCSADFYVFSQSCFDPGYVTVRRSVGCHELTTETKCIGIAGCMWDAEIGACSFEENTVAEALDGSQELATAFQSHLDCLQATTCDMECEAVDDACIFPGFTDQSNWVVESTPFCQFIKQSSECVHASDACPSQCTMGPSGACLLSFESEGFIDIAYAEDPELQEEMKAALQQCPIFTRSSPCINFAP